MNDSVVATTALGQLAGRRVDGVAVFRGVPYATAARFAAPQPVAGWDGVRDAAADGAVSPQPPSRLRLVMGDIAPLQGEDCLNLTIFTPAADGARRPVLVWFHGGGYSSGAGSLAWYDGARLAREGDVVVVGVNYRLGPLGYLYVPGVVPGNLGLRDQQMALDWVSCHVAAFGGDAGNVTLIGQSAGGHTIACLMTRPESRVQFRRAIIQSPPLGLAVQTAEAAEKIGRLFVEAAGIDPDASDALDRLRAAPLDDLRAAQGAAVRATMKSGDTAPPFLPVGDGAFLATHDDFPAALGRAAADIEMIIGTNREEMQAFYAFDPALQALTEDDLKARLRDSHGARAADRLDRVRRRRPGAPPVALYGDIANEDLFLLGSLDLAALAGTAFVYQFDWQSPDARLQSCHCLELPFFFGPGPGWAEAPMLAGADPQGLEALSAAIRGAIVAFARSGRPDHPDLPAWPAYEASRRMTMHLDVICHAAGDPAGRDDPALP
jgi:para-nitrobenzyl esterase